LISANEFKELDVAAFVFFITFFNFSDNGGGGGGPNTKLGQSVTSSIGCYLIRNT
jgi:hypothetical protein